MLSRMVFKSLKDSRLLSNATIHKNTNLAESQVLERQLWESIAVETVPNTRVCDGGGAKAPTHACCASNLNSAREESAGPRKMNKKKTFLKISAVTWFLSLLVIFIVSFVAVTMLGTKANAKFQQAADTETFQQSTNP